MDYNEQNNAEQKPGDNKPQTLCFVPVASVDDGNHPLNEPRVEQKKSILTY